MVKRYAVYLRLSRGRLAVVLAFVCSVYTAVAKDDRLVVRNVELANPTDGSEKLINLRVSHGKLDVVTTDPIPVKEEDQVFDAHGGFILGNLQIGQSPSFMILNEDPRTNFDAILDTEKHAVFVLKKGDIIRNRLSSEPAEEPVAPASKEPKTWFAYTPPPFALPIFYEESRRWNRFDTKYISGVMLGALVLDRMAWLSQNGDSEAQVGDLSPYSGGDIRALRLGVVGTLNFENPWIYVFSVATHAFDQGYDSEETDALVVFDARVDIPLGKDLALGIGKQKEPISMERLTSMINLPMQERSAIADSMMPARNIGVVLSGTAFDRRSSWAGGVFNPGLDRGVAFDEAPTELIGRGTWLPVVSPDESSLIHLGLGLRYTNAKDDLVYRSKPEFYSAPTFVDTGSFGADDGMLYDLEAGWRWGPFLLNGEYVFNQVHSPETGDPLFTGFHVTASYILTGEMRPYNRRSGLFEAVPIAKPVTLGGLGAWEVAARYSNADLSDGTIDGGKTDIFSLGLNWWLGASASLGVNYRHIVLDQDGMTGHSDGLVTRITLLLE